MVTRWPEPTLPAPTADVPSVPLRCLQAGYKRRPGGAAVPRGSRTLSIQRGPQADGRGQNPSLQASEPPRSLPSPGTQGMSEIGTRGLCVSRLSRPFEEGDQAVEVGAEGLRFHPLPGLEPRASSCRADVRGPGAFQQRDGGQIHRSPRSCKGSPGALQSEGGEGKPRNPCGLRQPRPQPGVFPQDTEGRLSWVLERPVG